MGIMNARKRGAFPVLPSWLSEFIFNPSAASGKPVRIRRGPAAVTRNETATAISRKG